MPNQTEAMSNFVATFPCPQIPAWLRARRSSSTGLGNGTIITKKDGRLDIDLDEGIPRVVQLAYALTRRPSILAPQRNKEVIHFPLKLNILLQVVGSRGDVQPFIVLGKALQAHGHRVRLATHLMFRDFVNEHGLEFFNIGGDPGELMSFMVKNPYLIPNIESLFDGSVTRRRKELRAIIGGCWRSCFEAGEGISTISNDPITVSPFVADAIIANPPSFAHIHCAEKLGVPLHMMFTMPWSPTQAFPHPLANIASRGTERTVGNLTSYVLTEMLIWQGVGDLINDFRRFELGLDQLDDLNGSTLIDRLQIPFTYLWSPSLLGKPNDWKQHIEITGFNFLPEHGTYKPPQDLVEFLSVGDPPIYIGFGSIVVDDPDALTKTILNAVKLTGQRALVSKGWGGLGAEQINWPDVFFLDNVPHHWLFKHVSCVVHHGGAGTTATGLALGRPTLVVPFFGDQPFWGSLVAKNGAGPEPIPHKTLTADNLANAIAFCLTPTTVEHAQSLSQRINAEDGAQAALESFHQQLRPDQLRCALCPNRPAVWRIRETKTVISAFAAAVLIQNKELTHKHIKLYRAQQYDIHPGAETFGGAVDNFLNGFIELPVNMTRIFSQPVSDRVAAHFNLDSCNAQTAALQTLAVSSASAESPDITTHVHAKTIPKAHKRGFLQRTAVNIFYVQCRFLNWLIQIPMGTTYLLAHGLHNIPRLYHDRTVRDTPEIIGFRSGLHAAGKVFINGFYDGVTGIVTHPAQGWKDNRISGMAKGLGKGLGGIFFKPQAGLWGLLGFPLKGIHRGIERSYGADRKAYIFESRISQGFTELGSASNEEKNAVLEKWKSYRTGALWKIRKNAV
ncbi:hypothetical protein BDV27DRAFT_132880 [Aspergillus caelatus]|uniref:Uncharacterized protein n=1 Tax=Aspergillus caelatus TaxID=61420 RepID=A0A5N6ZVK1_9EURO|nr:uncharacterized protein BDV27DRAFT_132880 [Aspergillus caelatus]KAE8361542.1 hypothetical protein BDV27DRAFT_132880 [Aspergillus caelatus]